jgi:hypothetical protein
MQLELTPLLSQTNMVAPALAAKHLLLKRFLPVQLPAMALFARVTHHNGVLLPV